MCVSAGMITDATRSSADLASISSGSSQNPGHDPRHSSQVTPKKRGFFGFFSREKSIDPPERANISLHKTSRGKDRKRPLLTFKAVTQAFAVYPERPKLISSSVLIKLEGTYGDEEMCKGVEPREGWMLLTPDLEGAGSAEMLRWLIGEHVPSDKSF